MGLQYFVMVVERAASDVRHMLIPVGILPNGPVGVLGIGMPLKNMLVMPEITPAAARPPVAHLEMFRLRPSGRKYTIVVCIEILDDLESFEVRYVDCRSRKQDVHSPNCQRCCPE
jgi:hypothetical protein